MHRIQAGSHAQDDSFRDSQIGAGDNDLVDGFGRLAAAKRTEMSDRPPDGPEDGHRPLHVRVRAADEHRERREAGPFGAPGDGRIDHRHAASGQPGAEATRCLGRDRRTIDHEQTLARSLLNALGAEEDGFDVGRVGDADHDHVRTTRDVGR